MRRRASRKNRCRWKPINGIRKKKVRRIWRVAKRRREREKFRAHRSYNINDPVCTRAHPVESWIPGQPPSRPIYISVLFKHDCYSISTQLVNALLFNRVARRRAGLVSATRRTDVSSRTKGVWDGNETRKQNVSQRSMQSPVIRRPRRYKLLMRFTILSAYRLWRNIKFQMQFKDSSHDDFYISRLRDTRPLLLLCEN